MVAVKQYSLIRRYMYVRNAPTSSVAWARKAKKPGGGRGTNNDAAVPVTASYDQTCITKAES